MHKTGQKNGSPRAEKGGKKVTAAPKDSNEYITAFDEKSSHLAQTGRV
jgi:hypothetical protein